MDKHLLLLGALLLCHAARADDDDTRLLLDGSRLQMRQQEAAAFSDGLPSSGSIEIDGETYLVPDTAHDLELGIYYALDGRQWAKVREFAARYRRLPDHKPQLVLLAEGLEARAGGNIPAALEKMQAAHQSAPDDVRIGLELARLYGEDGQTRESQAQFKQVLPAEMPPETREMVQAHLQSLDQRRQWHGSISIGGGYNDNINQGNGKRECAGMFMGQCFSYRSLPAPVGSPFWQYSAVAAKKIPLRGHHNLLLRPLAYGTKYRRDDTQSEPPEPYSENTAALYAGYEYTDADDDFTFTPYFEHYYRGGRSRYRAWGAEAGWERNLNAKWSLNARAEAKRVKYLEQERQYYSDYTLYSGGLGLGYTFSDGLGLYGGLDLARRKYPYAASSSKEYTARLGGYKMFQNGIYFNAAALRRLARYDAGSYLTAGEPRRDRQTIFTAAIGASKWSFKNIYPELRFKRTTSRSNSDFYVYRQNEFALALKYRF
ncbi:TPR repeat-containing protein NMB0313 precursor [Kingella potus]|uniref:TPR repeat-containing protein NMB0313 n=1 Tax=Kingella potus TaxID=265175 RepID=A0A377R331_9NEIS|nr:surface lipoprotein assembly modifier [Kingella potus]STR03338.1 TPR repeat-containing protein NMB0313 precursor [Kingella potus]